MKTLHEVEIEVTPQELPHSLAIDLTSLRNVGDHITAAQIQLPSSATLITGAGDIVASIKEFKEEKEEITPAPETVIVGEENKAEAEATEGLAPAEGAKTEKPAK